MGERSLYFCNSKPEGNGKKFSDTRLKNYHLGRYQSGQMGQTVNLLAYAFGGSNPSAPTKIMRV